MMLDSMRALLMTFQRQKRFRRSAKEKFDFPQGLKPVAYS
jgi:hypothetical protein